MNATEILIEAAEKALERFGGLVHTLSDDDIFHAFYEAITAAKAELNPEPVDFTKHLGATVEWCGAIGKIVKIDNDNWPVLCYFETSNCYFTADGRSCTWHTKPSLKLISPAKVKRRVTVWANVYPGNHVCSGGYKTKDEADSRAESGRVACVPVEFDIEEEVK